MAGADVKSKLRIWESRASNRDRGTVVFVFAGERPAARLEDALFLAAARALTLQVLTTSNTSSTATGRYSLLDYRSRSNP
ncbi:hypothetical protein EYF80_042984 [Liparis tanakae]|uniref:Uncharacterized protein n=1 Tax=Liparis tanakae TaxID=230148 RepID=A0A4Z2G1W1_9TELE|nr:hypothetical protein EYF80_042984 [Liparis tanakae]